MELTVYWPTIAAKYIKNTFEKYLGNAMLLDES